MTSGTSCCVIIVLLVNKFAWTIAGALSEMKFYYRAIVNLLLCSRAIDYKLRCGYSTAVLRTVP